MFLRRCYRRHNGKRHAYWALVESHRTQRGPRQRVAAYLGEMYERGRLGIKQAASDHPSIRQRILFEDTEPDWFEMEERVKAHILVCFLAYVLWNTLSQLCPVAGLGDSPRKVFDELRSRQ